MPVEFLTDSQAAAYAAYDGAPSRTELERFFFLDDADRALIEPRRRAYNRLGFAAQLTTVRYLGVFLDDPTDVPAKVADYLAKQLGIADALVLKTYGDRENTRLDHVRELRRVLKYTEFAEAEAELRVWVDARAWTTGGPEGAVRGAGGVAAGASGAAARGDGAGPAGRLVAGDSEPAAVGHPPRAAEHWSAGCAGLAADGAAGGPGVGAGPAAAGPAHPRRVRVRAAARRPARPEDVANRPQPDYGAFQDAARGRVDLARIERHWEDTLRIIGSIHTGAVRAYDVIRMLSRDGRPTPIGDAIAHYGRIAKTLHILRLADEPGYRRQIKVQANLQEGRHSLARKDLPRTLEPALPGRHGRPVDRTTGVRDDEPSEFDAR
ncbi:Tn3 family transposase [Streptomyces europaeiscabiei]